MRKLMIALTLWSCVVPAFAAKPSAEAIACTRQQVVSAGEIGMLAEVNRARQSPREYADTLRRVFASMDANGVYARGARRVGTLEGRAAVEEALRFLSVVEPAPPLRMASCLNLVAARHARVKGNTGDHGHFDAIGRDPSQRASVLTSHPVGCSENIAYGFEDATEAVAALIVDDGVPGRGHRGNLFDPRMRTFGSGRSVHLLRKTIDVQLFCLDDIEG